MNSQTVYRMTVDEWAAFSSLLDRYGLYTENFSHAELGQVVGLYDPQGKIRKMNNRARAMYNASACMLYVLDTTANLGYIIREVNLQQIEETSVA